MSLFNSTARSRMGVSRHFSVLLMLPGLLLVLSGCAAPLMELSHDAYVGTTYSTKGALQLMTFEDQRPSSEKVVGKTVTNSLTPQVWSGETNPDMMTFFQKTLAEEADRTGLFMIADTADYELSGTVNSMKVERSVDILYFLVPILGKTQLSATVRFNATLTKNGEVVFEKEIKQVEKGSYSSMKESGLKGITKRCAVLLDQTVSKSIRQLFDEIEASIM